MSESCADLHGGAAQANALLLDLGQAQGRPAHRAGRRCPGCPRAAASAARPGRAPAPAPAGAGRSARARGRARSARTRRPADARSAGRGRLGAPRESGPRRKRFGPGLLAAALGQHFDRAERSPGGPAATNAAATPRRCSSSASSISITSSSPSIPTASAKGNVIRGFG